jgi:hypothetical protein
MARARRGDRKYRALCFGPPTREEFSAHTNCDGGLKAVLAALRKKCQKRSEPACVRCEVRAGPVDQDHGTSRRHSDTIINEAFVREIKTRGREIVDAWDSYQADSDRAEEAVGLPELSRRWKKLNERRRRLWSRIAETPARTVDGMLAKIAFASSFNIIEREHLMEGTVDDLLLSAAMDYADIHGQEARS